MKDDLFKQKMTVSFHPPSDSSKFGADQNNLMKRMEGRMEDEKKQEKKKERD